MTSEEIGQPARLHWTAISSPRQRFLVNFRPRSTETVVEKGIKTAFFKDFVT